MPLLAAVGASQRGPVRRLHLQLRRRRFRTECADTTSVIGGKRMSLTLLDRWSPPGLLLESAAEIEMSRILETGPGTQARAMFARSDGWHMP